MMLEYQLKRRSMRQANRAVGPNYCEFLGFRPRVWPQVQKLLEDLGRRCATGRSTPRLTASAKAITRA